MKPPSEEDLFNELVDLVENDLRLRDQRFAIIPQPRVLRLQIGGQNPFWEYQVDKNRLKSRNLSAYAREVVDQWQKQRAGPDR